MLPPAPVAESWPNRRTPHPLAPSPFSPSAAPPILGPLRPCRRQRRTAARIPWRALPLPPGLPLPDRRVSRLALAGELKYPVVLSICGGRPGLMRSNRWSQECTMRIKLALIALLALTACNTVAGIGEDISEGAQTVGGWIGV